MIAPHQHRFDAWMASMVREAAFFPAKYLLTRVVEINLVASQAAAVGSPTREVARWFGGPLAVHF